MVLKIYGVPFSTCVRRVAVVCKELDIPYELITVQFAKGEHKSPEFLKKQPFGQIPVVDDEGFELYESRAIARYLAAKHKSPLLPTELKEVAKFEVAASLEYSNFDPFASKLAFEKVFKPMRGETTNEETAEELYNGLKGKLAAYDTILAKQKYLAGDKVTIADLFHLPYGYVVEQAGYKPFELYPNVKRWWADITSRPSWQAVKDGA